MTATKWFTCDEDDHAERFALETVLANNPDFDQDEIDTFRNAKPGDTFTMYGFVGCTFEFRCVGEE